MYCIIDLVTGNPLDNEGEFATPATLARFNCENDAYMHCAKNRIEFFKVIPVKKASFVKHETLAKMINDYLGGKNGKSVHDNFSNI